ncbi:hypothetical protein B6U82_01490 [Candidatus Pacearchaeota archaeon ex4484_31]|nr:MAG: hypothetical protein B6U82_01490 [Candidatus Pacearchaeota archaeon ex4484_31]
MKSKNIKEIRKILQEVLKKIKISEKERKEIEKKIKEFKKQMMPYLKKINAKFFVGGSFAKHTLIKKSSYEYDIDIFIRFPLRYKEKNISKILENIIKKRFRYSKLKGSRDYFQVRFKNLKFELIPILDIKRAEQASNIIDVSPLHVFYVLSKVKEKQGIADEICLAKSFCYAQNCYGAESYIKGFSGYALELLVIYYKSFLNFIKKASTWNENKKVIIDIEGYYKSKEEVLTEINEAKLQAPIVLIDPVQPNRNVCAALSHEVYARFIKACKAFLSNPSINFFFKQEVNIEKLKEKARRLKARFAVIVAKSKKRKKDVAGSKLKKFFDFLTFYLEKNGFNLLFKNFEFDEKKTEARYYFIFKEPKKQYLVEGPPLSVGKKFTEAFKKKWKKVFERNGRLYAKATRKFTKIEKFLESLKKDKLFKEMKMKDLRLEKVF